MQTQQRKKNTHKYIQNIQIKPHLQKFISCSINFNLLDEIAQKVYQNISSPWILTKEKNFEQKLEEINTLKKTLQEQEKFLDSITDSIIKHITTQRITRIKLKLEELILILESLKKISNKYSPSEIMFYPGFVTLEKKSLDTIGHATYKVCKLYIFNVFWDVLYHVNETKTHKRRY